jgi:hypothetical protein
MRVIGMAAWCRDSLGLGFGSQNDGPAGFGYYSNITGEGFRTLKGGTA